MRGLKKPDREDRFFSFKIISCLDGKWIGLTAYEGAGCAAYEMRLTRVNKENYWRAERPETGNRKPESGKESGNQRQTRITKGENCTADYADDTDGRIVFPMSYPRYPRNPWLESL